MLAGLPVRPHPATHAIWTVWKAGDTGCLIYTRVYYTLEDILDTTQGVYDAFGHDIGCRRHLLTLYTSQGAYGTFSSVLNASMHLGRGTRCELSLQGYGLESSNSLAVISAGDCGDADVEVVEIVSAINTTADMTQANYTLRNFSMDAVSFSPGDTYKLCWAHNATALGDFAVEIDASVELVGPYRTEVVCSQGFPCDHTRQSAPFGRYGRPETQGVLYLGDLYHILDTT